MALTKEKKLSLISEYGANEQDSGSSSSQVAMLTTRISELTEHLKLNPKDFACQRGLMILVGRRRRLLNFIKRHRSPEEYKAFITRLGLRK
jgi:small subunit ribosomal protein S15